MIKTIPLLAALALSAGAAAFAQPAAQASASAASASTTATAKAAMVRQAVAADSQPTIPGLYDVRRFGATGDGETLDTKAIQGAIDACNGAGGGTVLFASGNYVTGTIYLKSNVRLRVEGAASILGSKHIADYTTDTDRTMYRGEPYMNRCLIFAKDAENIGIEGSGTIDGQGKSFPEQGDRQRNRPKLIRLLDCTRVRIHDIRLFAPAAWTTEIRYCNDIAVDGISITSRANTNGDGLDFDGCTKVSVTNSSFDTGDDSICLQTSLPEKPCRDVTVSNCHFTSRWAGMRIGLLSRCDFENVAVTNCSFRDHNDSGLKIQMNEGAEMKNMTFSNLVMKNVPRPVFITFTSENAWVDAPRGFQPPMKRAGDMIFSDITVDTDVKDKGPGDKSAGFYVLGMPDHPVENITFSNIHASFPGGGSKADAADVLAEFTPENLNGRWPEYSTFKGVVPSFGLYARHVKGLALRNVDFSVKSEDARPPIIFIDVAGAKISDAPKPDEREH